MDDPLIAALAADEDSTRLKAALEVGSHPRLGLVEALIERCAVEPNFYVRDMLTWALTRYASEITVPKLLGQLQSQRPQARSQALHTLSKIKPVNAWPAITQVLLRDPDDEVARSAWRAAVVLVPNQCRVELAEALAGQFGRGGRDVQLSLSRALVALGEPAITLVLRKALASAHREIRAHAAATEKLLREPASPCEAALAEARKRFALGTKSRTNL